MANGRALIMIRSLVLQQQTGAFSRLTGRIDRETHIWFQPPAPRDLDGMRLRPMPAINANLSGRLAVLNQRRGLQVEVDTEGALHRFLDWYVGSTVATRAAATAAGIDPHAFREAFARPGTHDRKVGPAFHEFPRRARRCLGKLQAALTRLCARSASPRGMVGRRCRFGFDPGRHFEPLRRLDSSKGLKKSIT
jgi:hypothetical protein